MTAEEAVLAVLAALDAAGIPYMVAGSLASNFHGIPRSTRDADFVVRLSPDSLQRLERALAGGLELSDDPHDQARFARRVSARMLTREAFVASAEDMIITKLRWVLGADRPKDREDVRNILAVQGSLLDWSYLDQWSLAHGTARLLAEIRASVPPV